MTAAKRDEAKTSRLIDRIREAEGELESDAMSPSQLARTVLPLEGSFLRQLFEGSPDAMAVVDNEDRVLETSRGFTELFGYPSEEARGKLINELVAPGGLSAEASSISARVLSGEAVHSEALRMHKDGRTIPVSLIAYPIQYGRQQIGVVSIYRDASAQKRTGEQFRDFLQHAGAIAVMLDARGRIAFANSFLLDLLGRSFQEIMGADFVEACIPEETRPTLRHYMEELLSTGGSFEGVNELQAQSGRRLVSWSFSVLRDQYGRSSGLAGIGLDITAQEASRKALERRGKILEAVSFAADRFLRSGNWESEILPVLEKLGLASESGRACIVRRTPGAPGSEMLCEWCSRQAFSVPGPAPAVPIEQWHDTLFRNEIVSFAASVPGIPVPDELAARGVLSGVAVPVFRGAQLWGLLGFEDFAGERNWSSIETEALRAAADILGAAILRREFEKQLRNNMAQYAALIDNLSVGVLAESGDGTVLYANSALCTLFGLPSPSDILGRSLPEVSAAMGGLFSDPGEFTKGSLEVMEAGASVRGQEMILRSGLILERDYVPIALGAEKLGHLWLYRDVTEQRKAESSALHAQKLESLGLLAGGIAHDFNNLLTGILGNISLARMSVDDSDELARRLDDAEKASFRARALTHQLLTFSRGGEPVKKLTDIRGTIRDSAEFVLAGGRCRCEFRIRRNLAQVEVDEGLLSQVITNIVMNASQAMTSGGLIILAASNLELVSDAPPLSAGLYVHVTVADEGPGIPPENLERIFDPYFTTRPDGIGLGLAACYSIIARHGGQILVDSEVGRGTTFHIYLPASGGDSPEEADQGDLPDLSGCGRVMVVDDDEMVLGVAAAMLRSIGYRTDTAADCAEAEEKMKAAMDAAKPFSAIVLDLTMPGGPGGVETLKRLREIDPSIPAVVSSGYSTNAVMSNPALYGFDGGVAKPYRVEDLASALGQALRTGHNSEGGGGRP